jgi:colicin import membrane protein
MKISEILAERKLFEISRRDFLKGAGAAAGLAAVGKAGAQGNDWEYGRNALGNPKRPGQVQLKVDGVWKNIEDVDPATRARHARQEFDAVWKAKHGYTPSDQEYDQYRKARAEKFRQDAKDARDRVFNNPASSYAEKVRACVQPGVAFPPPPRKGSENPTAQFRVSLEPNGSGFFDIVLKKSSGNNNFDRAVQTGIRRCTPFPKPPKSSDGKYPPYIDINYSMYD